MELAEVQAVHAGVECMLFPTNDAQGAVALLERLRDLFGKTTIAADDALRLESLRQAENFRAAAGGAASTSEEFLKQVQGELTFDMGESGWQAGRALELVNKTNQFNLNGRRFSEGEWSTARPGRRFLAAGCL